MTLFRQEISLRPLRPYQEHAIAEVRQAVKEGHRRIVLQLPTGAGKTLIAAHLIAGAIKKGNRPLFTCPAISLIDQTLKAFEAEGITDIGVMQADHERTDREAQTQIASVQTLVRRPRPDIHFILVDEVHEVWDQFNGMLDDAWRDTIVIGLSATPWTKGMGLRWTKLVMPIGILGLIGEGYLTPALIYGPEVTVDRSKLKKQKGEYTDKSASEAMQEKKIVGNIVDTWKERGSIAKTFMFCVNRKHAKEQMGAFMDNGVPFGYIDGETPVEVRLREFAKMKYGEIAGIASVRCLIRGIDEDVRCLIDAQPTTSEKAHVQKWGRGIRPAEGKEHLVGLDHAGNNSPEGIGLFWEIEHDHLDSHKPGERQEAYEGEVKPSKPKQCSRCRALIPRGSALCPACGSPVRVHSGVEHEDGQLVLYGTPAKEKKVKPQKDEKQEMYSGLLGLAQERGYSEGWAAHRYKEWAQVWPRGLDKIAVTPTSKVRRFDHERKVEYMRQKNDKMEGSGVDSAGSIPPAV